MEKNFTLHFAGSTKRLGQFLLMLAMLALSAENLKALHWTDHVACQYKIAETETPQNHTSTNMFMFAPPVNDDCGGAIALTVNPDLNCGTVTAGTIDEATASPEDPAACGGTEDDDVWFTFVATATSHRVELLNIANGTTDLYHSVWEGACGSLTLVPGTCSDPNTSTPTGLTIGTTYHLRVYSWTSTPGQTSTFDVCIGTPPPPPANDDCTGAIGLTVENTGDCPANAVTGSNEFATDDGFFSCDGAGVNNGVWYSFVAPAGGDVNLLINEVNGNHEAAIFDACGGNEVFCDGTPNDELVTGLTAGNTYFLIIWADAGTSQGEFEVCLQIPPPPPANDDCANAIAINVENNGDCPANAVTGSTAQSTDDGFFSCDATGINNGVWYSFVAPAGGAVNLLVNEVSGNHEAAIFDACGGNEVFCDITPNDETVTGLTAGSTYFLVIWSDAGSEGTHEVCLQGICPEPSDLMVDNITGTSADLTWTPGGGCTVGGEYWVEVGGSPAPTAGTGTPIGCSPTFPINVTGLTSGTSYDVWVFEDCGTTNGTAGPVNLGSFFAVGVLMPPICENFDGFPTCGTLCSTVCPLTGGWVNETGDDADWLVDAGGTTSSGTGPLDDVTGGGNYLYTEASSCANNVAIMTSPQYDISGLGTPALNFSYHMFGDDMGTLTVDVEDPAGSGTFTQIFTISGQQQALQADPFIQTIIPLTVTGPNISFRFTGTIGPDFHSDMAIDEICVEEAPACSDPLSLVATATGATTATLGWDMVPGANSYDWEVVPQGNAQGVGVVASGNTTALSADATGLTANTPYSFYVRADCGGGALSNYSGPSNFATPCTTFNAPYTETFENGGTIPDCWTQGANNAEDWIFATTGGHVGNAGSISGSTTSGGFFAYVDDSSPQSLGTTLESPMVDVSGLTSPALSFFLISNNEGNSNVDFSVDVFDGAAWNVGFFTSNMNTANGGWEQIVLDLSTLTISGPIQVRFIVDENNGTDFYDDVAIDDVTVDELPSCPNPGGLMATNLTPNSADLTWTEGGGCTAAGEFWVVENGSPAPTAGTGTMVACPAVFPVMAGNLMANTTYDVYVLEDCGGNGTTGVVNIGSFTTLGGGTVNCGSALNQTHCYDNFDTQTFSYTSSDGISLLTLTFNAGGIEGCCDDIIIYDGSDSSFPILFQGNNGGDLTGVSVTSTGTDLFMEIDSDVSVSCQSGSGCCTTQWDWDVECFVVPTCPEPSNLMATNITPNSADLTWTPGGGCTVGAEYWVEMGGSPAPAVGSGMGIPCSPAFPVNAGSLSANTTYDVWVYEDCGANGTAGPVNIGSFTTPGGGTVICGTTLNQMHCYDNFDTQTFSYTSSDGISPLTLTFNAGDIESCCDDITIYDGSDSSFPILFQGNNGGDLTGVTVTSTGTDLFMDIDSDGSFSCQDGFCCSVQWDWDVVCEPLANCMITGIAVTNISGCDDNGTADPTDDFFTGDVTVQFMDAPSTGMLEVDGSGFADIGVGMLDGPTSHTFTGVTMPANGGNIFFTAIFTADPNCTFTENNAGTAPTSCSCSPIVNEVDYDQPGTDDAEFIELYNPCSYAIDLSLYDLDLINGSNNTAYQVISLPNVMLQPGEYYVICTGSGNVPNCDLTTLNSIQNGAPDAIGLRVNFLNIPEDAVSYEGDVPNYVEGSGVGLEDPGTAGNDGISISRFPNGMDTDQNNVDFSARCATPGEANSAATSSETFFADSDNDGFGDASISVVSCSQPTGFVDKAGDCDDNNANVNPDAPEVCDGVDNDCDGMVDEGVLTTFYADSDNDGFGDPAITTEACSLPAGFSANDDDCDDTNGNVNPNATEVCNGIDDDCDGMVDEAPASPQTWYEDADSDGFGNPNVSQVSCAPPPGFVLDNTDCDDTNGAVNPEATEVCNGIDDNCDGNVDEGVLSVFYADTDGDGFGDPANSQMACSAPAGFVANDGDCDDTNGAINPNADEICDGVDNDCDGTVDVNPVIGPVWYADNDSDGFGDPEADLIACSQPAGFVNNDLDCDDTDANINPNAAEVCNGIDDDCDGMVDEFAVNAPTWYEDADGDGFGNQNVVLVQCDQPAGFVANLDDCDDTDAAINPNTLWYTDFDGDGFGNPASSVMTCDPGPGFVMNDEDCNDNIAAINPNAVEICNGIDDNCDGNIDEGVLTTFFEDADNDGFGNPNVSQMACSAPLGFVLDNTDCDDTNAAVNPNATEVCNGIDDNCDGNVDEGVTTTFFADNDNDGFGDPGNSIEACALPGGFVTNSDDCDDTNAGINPNATEVCGNAIDDNCDGQVDEGCSCTVVSITVGNISDCDDNGTSDPFDDTFTADVTVVFSSAPSVGTLDLSGDGTASILAASLAGNSHTFVGVQMDADAGAIMLTAAFSADPNCTLTNGNAGIAPGPCSGTCEVQITNVIVTHETCPGHGDGTITIEAIGSGQVGYSIDGGANFQFDNVFTQLTPGTYDIVVQVFGTPPCEETTTATVMPPAPGSLQTWYQDFDNDGYSPGNSVQACEQPTGFRLLANLISINGDCNDFDPAENVTQDWFIDFDGDGYGTGVSINACERPTNEHYLASELTATTGDCDDFNAAIHPGAPEICNGIDDDCDGMIDEGAAGGLTFVGNVFFTSQAAVNAFSQCYSIIDGTLTIQNSNINDLSNLINLVEVTGNVTIRNTGLTSMNGLDNLGSVGGNLLVRQNNSLTTLDGFEGLLSVGGNLTVTRNVNLTDCCAIHDLINNGGVGGNINISRNDTGCDSISEVNSTCGGGTNLGAPNNGGQSIGIVQADVQQQVSIYPNPMKDVLTISIANDFETGSLKVLDLQGRLVHVQKIGTGNIQFQLELGHLIPGVYLIHLTVDGENFSERLVVE